MAYTIHFAFRPLNEPRTLVREIIDQLHDHVVKSPIAYCSEILEFNSNRLETSRFTSIPIELQASACKVERQGETWTRQIPIELIGFWCTPTIKSESVCFGFARYNVPRGRNQEAWEMLEWSWRGFCKSISPNNPMSEEIHRCIKTHLLTVLVLDKAVALGVYVDVTDETGYWLHRNVEKVAALLSIDKHCKRQALRLLAADRLVIGKEY
jgi:hypothetical protein